MWNVSNHFSTNTITITKKYKNCCHENHHYLSWESSFITNMIVTVWDYGLRRLIMLYDKNCIFEMVCTNYYKVLASWFCKKAWRKFKLLAGLLWRLTSGWLGRAVGRSFIWNVLSWSKKVLGQPSCLVQPTCLVAAVQPEGKLPVNKKPKIELKPASRLGVLMQQTSKQNACECTDPSRIF